MSEARIKLTRTMLEKYIIDANVSVVAWARAEWGVEYEVLRLNNRHVVACAVLNGEEKMITAVTFYVTRRGDKRLSIAKIGSFAKAGDEILLTKIK
tara:strand:+ start:3552 stop:3839 length:288 start_codon:yes stop_codon:yes gene_type:complete